eukprot:scaffold91_cov203-Alexandrium_tamarense.AAC.18
MQPKIRRFLSTLSSTSTSSSSTSSSKILRILQKTPRGEEERGDQLSSLAGGCRSSRFTYRPFLALLTWNRTLRLQRLLIFYRYG